MATSPPVALPVTPPRLNEKLLTPRGVLTAADTSSEWPVTEPLPVPPTDPATLELAVVESEPFVAVADPFDPNEALLSPVLVACPLEIEPATAARLPIDAVKEWSVDRALAVPAPLTELLLVVLPFAAIDPVEGEADEAALAAPLPEAEASPFEVAAVFDPALAVACPACEAAAWAAAFAPVLALPLPTLAAVVAVPTAAAAERPACDATPEARPEPMPTALPLPVLVAVDDEPEETPTWLPTDAVFADLPLLLDVPAPPTPAIPPALLLDPNPPAPLLSPAACAVET